MCEHAAFAVRKCPFLSQLAREHGEEFATSIALAPTKPVGAEPLPSGTDAVVALSSSFRLFHGPEGVVPLPSNCPHLRTSSGGRSGCPHAAQQAAGGAPGSSSTVAAREPATTRAVAPFATISLSGANFGDFLGKHFNKNNSKGSSSSNKPQQRPHSQQPRPQRAGPAGNNACKPPHGPAGASSSSINAGSGGPLGGGGSNLKPQRPIGDPTVGPSTGSRGFSSAANAAGGSSSTGPTLGSCSSTPTGWSSTGSSSGTVRGPSPFQQQRLGSSGSSSSSTRGSSGAADSKGGGSRGRLPTNGSVGGGAAAGCPLRKWLGPAAGLVFNQYDKLVCPPAIVSARAALAKTAAVQTLRPQALPVKLIAVAAVVAGVNLPCGAVREHFEKFSVGWFIAVHATIPFVAMLRKAVIMPKYAMVVTIAAAVLGQVVGSRMERARLLYEQQHGPLLPQLQPSLPLLQHQAVAGEEEPLTAGSGKGSSARGSKRITSAAGAAGRSTAQQADSSSSWGRGKGWRERLAADPEPAAEEELLGAGRCGSGSGGSFAAGGLFARRPLVKA